MDAALGVLLLAVYIAAIIGLAAGITFGVIKIFPTERNPRKADSEEKPAKSEAANGDTAQGSLFRRSKRGRS